MATAKHVQPFRRKREGRTNYKKRLSLLKSAKPRLVIRRSNKHLTLQLVTYQPDGDKVLVTVNSKRLAAHGWKRATKSTPAAYLAGILLAKAAKEKGVSAAIADLGLQQHRAGTTLCAAIKGAIDGGLSVPAQEGIFPPTARLLGEHISAEVAQETTALAKKLGVTPPPAEPKNEKPKEAQKEE